jgi:tripartite-type tricarboxylate transporter receptor subunit TctC
MISGKLVRTRVASSVVATAVLALSAIAWPQQRTLSVALNHDPGRLFRGRAGRRAGRDHRQAARREPQVSVVIENKTGANGMIAAQAAARTSPMDTRSSW